MTKGRMKSLGMEEPETPAEYQAEQSLSENEECDEDLEIFFSLNRVSILS